MTEMPPFLGDEDTEAQAPKPKQNGHDPAGALHLIRLADMRPRLGDGYLIKGLIGSGSMVVEYGESGSTKSFLALHIGFCIAEGREFFGHRVRQAGVVYVAAEAGRGIENRVIAAKQELGLVDDVPFAAVTTPIDLCKSDADVERLIETVRGAGLNRPVELIEIDTLSRVMGGGNENQPDDMGALVRNIDRLRAATGAAVILVHHSGKDASRGARGHSLLRAATDTEIEVTKDDGMATATVTKQREYATDGSFTYTLRQVWLGLDCDGDRVTSCIVEPSKAPASKKPVKLTGAAKVGYEQLKNCLADHTQEIPASSHVPAGAKGVTLDLWRGYLEKAGVVNRKGNPREQFRRIRVTLQDHGIIGVWDDFVWPSQPVTEASQ